MNTIILTNSNKLAIISDEDFERVNLIKWRLGPLGYAETGHEGYKLHHFVLGLTDFSVKEVHHKNNNKLDNQRSNLEVLDFASHLMTRPEQGNNKSGYKGVSWKNPQGNRKGRWVAQISYNKHKHFLGYFDTAELAAKAYDTVAKSLFGETAFLNFP